jgi:hypothetical protein
MNEVHIDRKQFVEALKVIAPKRLTKQNQGNNLQKSL